MSFLEECEGTCLILKKDRGYLKEICSLSGLFEKRGAKNGMD